MLRSTTECQKRPKFIFLTTKLSWISFKYNCSVLSINLFVAMCPNLSLQCRKIWQISFNWIHQMELMNTNYIESNDVFVYYNYFDMMK